MPTREFGLFMNVGEDIGPGKKKLISFEAYAAS